MGRNTLHKLVSSNKTKLTSYICKKKTEEYLIGLFSFVYVFSSKFSMMLPTELKVVMVDQCSPLIKNLTV